MSILEITSEQQAYQALARCKSHLDEDESLLLERGSKSHTVFRLTIKKVYRGEKGSVGNNFGSNRTPTKQFTTSSICFVSFANSEKTKKLDETQGKNGTNKSSLGILSKCFKDLKELREGQNSHNICNTWVTSNSGKPPLYKDSKLTRILYEYLYEDSNLKSITHVNLDANEHEETIKLLNFTVQLRGMNPQTFSCVPSASKGNFLESASKILFSESINVGNHGSLLFDEEGFCDKIPSIRFANDVQDEKIMLIEENPDKLDDSIIIDNNELVAEVIENPVEKVIPKSKPLKNEKHAKMGKHQLIKKPLSNKNSSLKKKAHFQKDLIGKSNSSKKKNDNTSLTMDERDVKIQVLEGTMKICSQLSNY